MAAAVLRKRYPFLAPELQVSHLVVGAGVVGLAVAERLVNKFAERTTFVVERHGQAGQETSSRNSEVIHSGIYYPSDSLKTSLCIRGRQLLYKRCQASSIPYRKTGKLIVATSKDQIPYLEGLVKKADKLGGKVPLGWKKGDELRELEPDLGEGVLGGLSSSETGIVDSHSLMEAMEKTIVDSDTGELVYGTRVVRIDRAEAPNKRGKRGDGSEDGWVVQTVTADGKGGEGERSAVLAKVVINAAGLSAHHLVNQILPDSEQLEVRYAKGNYYSYRGPGTSSIRHLIYPCPDPRTLGGLGTHLTMNLDNEIRFGPDINWIEPPKEVGDVESLDYWEKHLAVDEERMGLAIEEVRKFLPGVEVGGFAPDYTGIRPKLSRQGDPAADFSITHPQPGFISLTGIESPGLTSSLAIAEIVEEMLRNEVWGLGVGTGRTVSEAGRLDGWA
ncbi:BQ5605_C019g08996 [Microbotryum silenes-dioicae]|uniref:L-2-hydroxyglutarate dehydrogenase, mitochondrial n=1 Tax=Microbotryum silenes-dioicae TaxID=796604 RepID=A0A2X0M0A8_9BASI|nr:BQ5605_C019g08996 [Microbotryum silenes-dioicae]